MPSLRIQEAVKQAIVAVISGVNGTGQVFDRVKYSSNWQTFGDQFYYVDPATGSKQVRGWWVTLPTMQEDTTNSDFETHWHRYTYPLHAIMTYTDKGSSEPEFNNMIWSVFDILHVQGVLGLGPSAPVNGSSVIDGSIEIEVPTVDLRFYGSILCHHAQLQMSVGVATPIVWVP